MIYLEEFDDRYQHPDTTVVSIRPSSNEYSEMYDWCVDHDSKNRFASILHVSPFNGEEGSFYFENCDDALLFRLRWGHVIYS